MADGGKSLPDIAMRIGALMRALGHNQTSFAILIGVSQPALNNYLQGLRRPDLDVAMRINARTGVTLDWLYQGHRETLPASLLAILPDLSGRQQAG
jgi:transcriptional regulator with XRE-family HTH domain